MSLAHFTLASRDVERTAAFFERTFGYARRPVPANSPVDVRWLDIGRGQQMHVLFVDGFDVSAYEAEFGRHVAMFYPVVQFATLKERLVAEGAVIVDPLRPTAFDRFFFREPINGYVFEVIDDAAAAAPHA